MKRSRIILAAILASAVLLVTILIGVPYGRRVLLSSSHPKTDPKIEAIRATRAKADALYGRYNYEKAAKQYERIIQEHKDDPNPKIGEEVADVQAKLAFCQGRLGDYEKARETFQEVIDTYHGTGEVDEQRRSTAIQEALYQQAVCLQAEGKKEEAIKAFDQLMLDHPDCGLLKGARDRVLDMCGGKLPESTEKAWKTAEKIRTERFKKHQIEIAMCGPKALSHVAKLSGIESDAGKLAKIAGTNERGTSMSGLQKAAHGLGLSAVGLEVTHEGLKDVKLPSILMTGTHFVSLEEVRKDRVRVYDPSDDKTKWLKTAELPKERLIILQIGKSRG